MRPYWKIAIIVFTALFISIFCPLETYAENECLIHAVDGESTQDDKMQTAIDGNCEVITLMNNIDLEEPFEGNSSQEPITIKGHLQSNEYVTTLSVDGNYIIGNIDFDNVSILSMASDLGNPGTLSFNNVSFKNIKADYSVATLFSDTACLSCISEKTGFLLGGSSLFMFGKVGALNNYAFNIDTTLAASSDSIISFFTFMNQNYPYIFAGKLKSLDVNSNQFMMGTQPAFTSIQADGDQITMLANNAFFKVGGGSIDLSNLFKPGNETKMSFLEKPVLEYEGHDTERFKLKFIVPETINQDEWGDIACPGTSDGHHINIEPYYLKYENNMLRSMHPMGMYEYEKEGSTYYLKIKMNKKVDISKTDEGSQYDNFADMDKIHIAVLAHCEGYSTTVFSDPIKIVSCPEGEFYNKEIEDCQTLDECGTNKECPAEGEKICVSGFCHECAVDSDCDNQMLCQGNVCIEAPQCASDQECQVGEICQDQQCIVKPIIACSTDADCEANNYCSGSEGCLSCSDANPVNLICPGTSYSGPGSTVATECSDGNPPVCPVNSEAKDYCGGGCFCKDGYRSVGGQACVDELTSRVCPMGYVLNSASQECMFAVNTPPSKKSGCSLAAGVRFNPGSLFAIFTILVGIVSLTIRRKD